MSSPLPGTPRSSAGPSSAAVARLSARGLPELHAVRRTRLRSEPGALLLDDAYGRETRVDVGPEGIREAVHVAGPRLAELAPESLGAVDLHDAQGLRLRLDLRDWLPEHGEVADPQEALRRSGVREVLEHAGLGLRPVRGDELREALLVEPGAARVPSAARVPRALVVVQAAGVGLAVLALFGTLGLLPLGTVAVLPGAAGLLAAALATGAVRPLAVLRARASRCEPLAEMSPHPSGPTTARFLRTARLQKQGADIVVVDDLGRERWLPVDGPCGVTRLAVVRAGTPSAQVELRTADGTPRATLPGDEWVGAPDGLPALRQFAAQAGLPLDERAAPARRRQDEEAQARAVMARHGRSAVVRALDEADGLPGLVPRLQTPVFAVLLLLSTVGLEDASVARGLLVATLLLTAGTTAVRALLRRAWLDRERPVGRPGSA